MKIILSMGLALLPLLVMGQALTPEEIEARRKSGFKLVEWMDDNGQVQLISADSAAVLQARRDAAKNVNNQVVLPSKGAEPKEKIAYRYYYGTGAAGGQVVMEEKETTTTSTVERNGQQMQKKSSQKEISETEFRCLPVEPSDWAQFLTGMEALAATNTELGLMRANWQAYVSKHACLPPFVISEFVRVLPSDEYKKAFVADIYATCPNPKQADIQQFIPKEPVVVVKEEPKKEIIEPKPAEPVLTAKELKAKQKAELKALKAAEKAAAKAEKERLKAEKAAAKAAAKEKK